MDHAGTIGQYSIFWDRTERAFVVYDERDERVYVQPDGGMSAFAWCDAQIAAMKALFGDIEFMSVAFE